MSQPDLFMSGLSKEDAIRNIVASSVAGFAATFSTRHIKELHMPDGVINSKIHNVFLAELSPEVQYYSSLGRSFDSSLGNQLEAMAINIARLSYDVSSEVEGPLSIEQTHGIAGLLEQYNRLQKKPEVSDYAFLREKPIDQTLKAKRHVSDYHLTDRLTGDRFLIELKAGGDLDNKKSRSEKEAILEQYAILSNTLPRETNIRIFFATAYNRYGEGKPWVQGRVRQFFAVDELLIGRDFWNLVCRMPNGYEVVMDAYREHAHLIREALDKIKRVYLG
jgi:hypothetical protein